MSKIMGSDLATKRHLNRIYSNFKKLLLKRKKL